MIIIELRGYDAWKTSPPEPKGIAECYLCHDDLYQYETVWKDMMQNRWICESCRDDYIEQELEFVKQELFIED